MIRLSLRQAGLCLRRGFIIGRGELLFQVKLRKIFQPQGFELIQAQTVFGIVDLG